VSDPAQSLSARLTARPQIFDPARAARVADALGLDAGHPAADLIAATASNSAYLSRSMQRETEFLKSALDTPPEAVAQDLREGLLRLGPISRDDCAAALRTAKRRAALLVALCDLGGVWPLEKVCGELTAFADAALTASLRFALRQQMEQGRWTAADPTAPERDCGLFFLGMGKYGAGELNYSSDIDFSCYFEPEKLPLAPGVEPKPFAVRVTQIAVALMQDVTADGYVFRCDLRMRPDAGSTQIAMTLASAEHYYEAMGQNWERAAMIKARPCAGDIAEGEAYLKRLAPFIWRKYLDYAAIEDIHSIKRQIHAQGHFGAIHVPGQNVKLGPGGIREIEFFAQTQQLIMGGRDPTLRSRKTLEALNALTDKGVVHPDVNADLRKAYAYLRTLEHRLQMIEDEQTHSVPKSAEGVDNAARFMAYAKTQDFIRDLTDVFETVHGHYSRLFEKHAPLSEQAGNLVFTGVEDDAETLKTLKGLGFSNPSGVAATVRGWHHGRVRATRSARARERLTELMPLLLKSLGESANPDIAFTRFDKFLSGLPSGVQVFELLFNNPHLLKTIADIVGTAPRMADHLAKRPALFEALTDPGFLTHRPGPQELETALDAALRLAEGFEGKLDACRRWAQDEQFRICLQLLRGAVQGAEAGRAFAAVASAVIVALKAACRMEMEASHGKIPGGALSVVGLGRLGSEEMTVSSDLDLIFIYDHAPDAVASDGAKPLQPGPYYARAAQRLITALTALTAEGELYEVDMRLRPSGNKGPVAVSLESFAKYQAEEAWTWERMALTRARFVAGPPAIRTKVESAIRDALTKARDPAQTLKDAADMRGRLEKDTGRAEVWNVKSAPGGLIDIEFVAQSLMAANAAQKPGVLRANTREALAALRGEGVLPADDAEALDQALTLYENVLHVLRLTVDEPFKPADASPSLKASIARAAERASFEDVEAALAMTMSDVRSRFLRLVGPVGP
jgi:[glutamine synthetase] adenylyltransferase / [glutamine synthetase]-adenylyl-L-tyrosine phosphorylase